MPLVTCPNCPTRLKVPDGASGNVKCPKCGTVFPAAPKPAFEVVDDEPPSKSKPTTPSKASASLPKAPVKAAADDDDDDFEVIDEAPKKRVVAADDDDDDEPKKKKKKRQEDEAFQPLAAGDKGGFGFAETGAKLIGLSLGLYIGTFLYLALLLALAWAGVAIPGLLVAVAGLLGLGNWTLGLMGCAHCLAGPARVRGPAATVLAVAIVHLLLTFSVGTRGTPPASAIPLFSSMARAEDAKKLIEKLLKETDPAKRKELEKELDSLRGEFDEDRPGRPVVTGGGGEPLWHHLATQSKNADRFVAILGYDSRVFSHYLIGLVAGFAELLRLVLMIALLGVVANAARDGRTARGSLTSILLVLGATLASMIVMLVVAGVVDDAKPSSSKPGSPSTATDLEATVKKTLKWFAGGELLVYLIHAGGLVLAAVTAAGAKDAAARRA